MDFNDIELLKSQRSGYFYSAKGEFFHTSKERRKDPQTTSYKFSITSPQSTPPWFAEGGIDGDEGRIFFNTRRDYFAVRIDE